jgi:hypothetical protein
MSAPPLVGLLLGRPRPHRSRMKVKPKKSSGSFKAAKKLGRSALTGVRVLQPAAKRANISLERVRRAVRALNTVAGK